MTALSRAIVQALEACARCVKPTGAERWTADLGNGSSLPVTAWREDEWLQLSAPYPAHPAPASAWDILVRNGRLTGPARLTRAARSGRLELRAELPLHDPGLLPLRLTAACESLRLAAHPGPDARSPEPLPPPPSRTASATDPGALARVAAERGWPSGDRPDAEFAVELDTPGLYSQARVEEDHDAVRLWTDLGEGEPLTAGTRDVIALYLLTLTGGLRMVRAVAGPDDAPAIRLVAPLARPVSGADLDLGLSALSLAHRLAAREVRSLRDPALARLYDLHITMEE